MSVTEQYPNAPGFLERNGTSQQAAHAVAPKDEAHRAIILRALKAHGSMTADQAGEVVGLNPLQCRPRVTQLYKLGLVEKTGEKRPSSGGSPSWVWRAVEWRTQQELL